MAGFFADYFLLFLLAAAGGGYVAYRTFGSREKPARPGAAPFDYRDPYLIAALRGGTPAVVELAIVALLDRGLLQCDDLEFNEKARLKVSRPDAVEFTGNAVEQALLRAAASPIGARDIAAEFAVVAAASSYGDRLLSLGLAVDRDVRIRRRAEMALCFVPAIALVAIRMTMEPAHWFFFAVLGAFVIGIAFYSAHHESEARGEAMLNELVVLFAGLSARAKDLRRGRMVSEAMFCAATFGLWLLPAAEYPAAVFYSAEERRRRNKSDNSSCGSGSGGGSGCGSNDDGGGGGGDSGGGGCGGGCGGG